MQATRPARLVARRFGLPRSDSRVHLRSAQVRVHSVLAWADGYGALSLAANTNQLFEVSQARRRDGGERSSLFEEASTCSAVTRSHSHSRSIVVLEQRAACPAHDAELGCATSWPSCRRGGHKSLDGTAPPGAGVVLLRGWRGGDYGSFVRARATL
jgi:hypothetical protein